MLNSGKPHWLRYQRVRLGDHSCATSQVVLMANGQSVSLGLLVVWHKAVVNTLPAAYPAARTAQPFSVKPFGFEENFFFQFYFVIKSQVRFYSFD